ncbi:conserved Plasmodium protein, unknown function [Plasmodium knowlesi strain H]|uniref:Uncharacterized protein n=3 Tax=Plasmodium knowlesi TaxID=5850 RepID=A0A5K1V5D6_PLAKH|nr:conserved Plasmodium protein, unknown function [Plasmodium knowlesi strain H]OTN64513.1 Uncharacterized protein PKNOH_S130169400 [Plasmodium knowlesi]CAA9988862.1 conserved Plasmodium protein, unknown function [Plasmodium knowlesi strain H]SBO24694.1 conserved Plasmodium protein, unknown function [Plasmodium knowlesi strain H]SBO27971.1 conserved Plasmodium protein, unknown function [Plasmodium knowlesi strain H]VVS78336.1 conserved Plasmodium protein, unknown function [Plasmodium knowlesi |eukprot:XP_002261208.1 hypothetical protein, conserved in Plasmodium species [Plasmodium knowlesi strain H]
MKVCIRCFTCILLIFLCAVTAYGSAERWVDNENANGVGERGRSLLSTTDADDFEGRLNKEHHRGSLRSVYSVGKGVDPGINEPAAEASFLSVRSADTEEEGGSDDDDDEDERKVNVSMSDQNGELTYNANDTDVNQMVILKDITDKVKREVTDMDMDRVNEVDIPSIADEERKINEFYEYENETLKNIHEKKKNIYAMINEDLDELLKPAQREYIMVARSIKRKLLHEYEQILQEELSQE